MKNVIYAGILLLVVNVFSCKTTDKPAETEPAFENEREILEQSLPEITQEEEPVKYNIKVTGKYPVIDDQPNLSNLVRNYAIGLYQDLENEILENDRAARAAGNFDFAKTEFTFDVSWKAGRNDRQFCSILLDVQWYAGGAHGAELVESFNLDVATGKLISVRDIMPLIGYTELAPLAKYVQTELVKKIVFSYEGDEGVFKMIQDGTSPVEENFRVFFVERDGVTFYFQRYQVAPGAAGVQSVKIPVRW
jgi:hypothetical protein